MMTLEEVHRTQASPEYVDSGRIAVLCYETGDGYVTSWAGVEYRAGNPFGLDGQLMGDGCPQPHNLYLVSHEDYERGRTDDQR